MKAIVRSCKARSMSMCLTTIATVSGGPYQFRRVTININQVPEFTRHVGERGSWLEFAAIRFNFRISKKEWLLETCI